MNFPDVKWNIIEIAQGLPNNSDFLKTVLWYIMIKILNIKSKFKL